MKTAPFSGLLALLLASTAIQAHAADVPRYAAAPAWVKPTPIPKPGAKTDASSQLLLLDRQERLTPEGDAYYFESAQLIQTPEGLSDAATVNIVWSPDIETVVVHRIALIRDGNTIDLLADGRELVVLRREASLESATLDGRLTATLQPEGLEVGDVLDVAYTLERRDPVLAGAINSSISGVTARAVKSHVSQSWPSNVAMRWAITSDLPKPKVQTAAGMTEISWMLDSPEPATTPGGAPGRFARAGQLDSSSFADWQAVSRLMAPLYATAATLKPGGALAAEAAKIAAASTDPVVRANAALALVQDRIRYFYNGLGNGGYIPAAADLSWSRRFGDCKGKTVVLLSLLKALGIEAVPALVSSGDGDGLDTRPPAVQAFDHVIVRATIGGAVYWLDGTRAGDRQIGLIETPAFMWALPVTAAGSTLEALPSTLLKRPSVHVALEYDIRAGTSAPVPATMRITMRGPQAVELARNMGNAPAGKLKEGLSKAFAKDGAFVVDTASYTVDKETGDLLVSLAGKAKLTWQQTGIGRRYQLDEGMEQTTFFTERDAATATTGATGAGKPAVRTAKAEVAPFAIPPLSIAGHFTVLLPAGETRFSVTGADMDETVAGFRIKRTATMASDRVVVDTLFRSVRTELPYAETIAANPRLREITNNHIFLRDARYVPGKGEDAAVAAARPTTLDALLDSGSAAIDRGQFDRAIGDMDAAVKLAPRSARAFANRGIARMWQRDYALADKDFAAAETLDPKEIVWMRGRGAMLARQGRFADAEAMFGRALAVTEDDRFSLGWRVDCRRMLGKTDAALEDADALAALNGEGANAIQPRVAILVAAGRGDAAISAIDAAMTTPKPTPNDWAFRAATLESLDRHAEAATDYGKMLAEGQSVAAYLGRSRSRKTIDPKGALADAEAAVALDPRSSWAITARAELLADAKAYDRALAGLEVGPGAGLADTDAPLSLRLARADVYRRSGRPTEALAEIAAARTLATSGEALNELCWWEATKRFALDAAPADCRAAVALAPEQPAFLDSQGLALMQVGRDADAIAVFDHALALGPFLSASLYARGIARQRTGDLAGASRDIAAARVFAPTVATRYAEFGVVPARP